MTATHNMILADGGVHLVTGMTIFALAGLALGLGALLFGRLLRPKLPNPAKGETYECGEVAVGQSWVQFDLRFYVVALVFLVFDVEIALLYPWAVVFGGGSEASVGAGAVDQVRHAALWDMLFFFGVLVVGFLYLWRFGYLDWVWAFGNRVTAKAEDTGGEDT
jgi:NADH-quinone oxidoreductase subunit A